LVKKIRTFSKDPQLVIERRKLIAERSLKVFLEKGFGNSTIRDLGKACGVTPGALYHYIGSKEDILHLIVISYPLDIKLFKERFTKLGKINCKTALLECFTLFCHQLEIAKDYNRLFTQEWFHLTSQDRRMLGKSKQVIYDLIEWLITEGVESEEFRVRNIKLTASGIVNSGYNWINRSWFAADNFNLEESINEQFQAFFEPLIVEPKSTLSLKTTASLRNP